ncbi:hypothetical protein [Francisella philomiragia]|uniref:hypothetical protein n=1 Tax=Francisella philomiragia TaxID=28110 RepID=UPI0019087A98|nr:hypothetical protein [Francisella philomiragia]MBK2296730.1 hypothetical protein [Francisella philomiragia]MBK2341467.1 hypothetical protein [Francisella philomiragia]
MVSLALQEYEYTLVYLRNKNIVDELYGILLDAEDEKEYMLENKVGFYKKEQH